MTYFMGQRKDKASGAPQLEGASGAERRRLARIVRDDRGNAQVEWTHAPDTYERPVLSVEGEPPRPEGYDPYQRDPSRLRERGAGTTRTDLRRLSDWIKQMRELEARRQRGDDPPDEE